MTEEKMDLKEWRSENAKDDVASSHAKLHKSESKTLEDKYQNIKS